MTKAPKEITEETVRKIANLSMINLTDDEVKKYQSEISKILGYVEKIKEVDTKDFEFKSHVDLKNVYHSDTPQESLTQDEATSGRKEDSEDGFITISHVLDR